LFPPTAGILVVVDFPVAERGIHDYRLKKQLVGTELKRNRFRKLGYGFACSGLQTAMGRLNVVDTSGNACTCRKSMELWVPLC
jgi:hypothetical protein